MSTVGDTMSTVEVIPIVLVVSFHNTKTHPKYRIEYGIKLLLGRIFS